MKEKAVESLVFGAAVVAALVLIVFRWLLQ